MRCVRQLSLGDLTAELLDQGDGALEDLLDARLDPLGLRGELLGDAEAEALEVLPLGSSIPPSIPIEVESQGSRPSTAPRTSAASVTSLVRGPHWSSEEAKAIIP